MYILPNAAKEVGKKAISAKFRKHRDFGEQYSILEKVYFPQIS